MRLLDLLSPYGLNGMTGSTSRRGIQCVVFPIDCPPSGYRFGFGSLGWNEPLTVAVKVGFPDCESLLPLLGFARAAEWLAQQTMAGVLVLVPSELADHSGLDSINFNAFDATDLAVPPSIDEAKDFVPAQAASVCKASLMRLVAQARKYHLGLVLATQNPKEIENTMIGNCSTQYFGQAGSPEAIRVVREQIRLRRGSGDDIPTLPRGTFYVYNADANMASPVRVRLPMCLSHHRRHPLDEQEILR